MSVDGYKRRKMPKKGWMDYLKDNMNTKGIIVELTNDRYEWNPKTYRAE